MNLIRAGNRDLRVDFFRGLALWWIFTDHIPGDVLGDWSLQNFTLCDAAEVFVLLAGYGAGLAYGGIMRRSGFFAAAASVIQRAWTLYVAHIFLFVVFSAQVGYSSIALARANYVDESKLDVLAHQPYQALLEALTLRYQPSLLNILPLYVVLLLMFIPALALLRFPRLLGVLSLALWLAAYAGGLNLSSWTGGGWFFDPFAWQLLFITGAILATSPVRIPIPRRVLDAAAIIVIAFGLAVIYLVWRHAGIGFLLPLPVFHALLYIDKTTLDPLRIASIAALLWGVVRLVPKDARWLRLRVASPLVIMGQHSLPVFCWGIFIGFFGRLALEWRGSPDMQVLVNAGGLTLMVMVAVVAAWYGERARAGRTASAEKSRVVSHVALVTLALAGSAALCPATAARVGECPTEAAPEAAPASLGAFVRALHTAGTVDILAVGSSSTAATGASYPRVAFDALRTALPGANLRLTIEAARGLTAQDMLGELTAALARRPYALVLWQTGTVDAVRGLPVEELADALEEGAARIAAASASLVLIDPQFSRFLSENADLQPYEEALERTASLPGVALFPRYALMQSWADTGALDIESASPELRPALADRLNACLGHALAGFILSRTRTPPRLQ